MKKLITISILLCVCLLTLSASPQQPKRWEYKVSLKKCNDEKTLNALGDEGWELATYAVWPVGMSSVDTCVFKRPK